jgi:hypothetical protein
MRPNMAKSSAERRDFPELEFAVVIAPDEYFVEYKIYEIVANDFDGKPLFQRAGSHFHPDPVERLDEAEVYLEGSVKWDGCSNWNLDDPSGGLRHFCSREQLENVGKILAACYDLTPEFCPNYLEESFELTS